MAGQLVDCPTCGRTLRVPRPDGQTEPVPQPKLNLQDAGLTQALDELARIGTVSTEEHASAQDSDQQIHVLEPAPLPEPIPIQPPLPPEPAPRTAPRPRSTTAPSADPDAPVGSGFDIVTDRPALRSARTSGRRGSQRPDWWSLFPRPVILALCGTAVTALLLGYFVGRSRPAAQVATSNHSAANGRNIAANEAHGAAPAESRAAAVKGRITYKTESGLSRPDRGARVIVFPNKREGEAKLPVAGCRPGDSTSDFQVSAAALRALGGNMAVADDDGHFALTLPQAGNYHVLVLSHYQKRGDEQPPEPALTTLLESYFDRPEQLLGQFAYHFGQIRYKGEGTEIWDHSFEGSS